MDERGFNIVIRPEWKAKPAFGINRPVYPLPYVIVNMKTGTEGCHDRESCSKVVRNLQAYHQHLGMSDVHYNFLIGGDGMVYEGRGWCREPSASVKFPEMHTKNYSIAYIGDWADKPVTYTMNLSFLRLLKLAKSRKYLANDCKIIEVKDCLNLVEYRDRQNVTLQKD